jgi:hypothetical protein
MIEAQRLIASKFATLVPPNLATLNVLTVVLLILQKINTSSVFEEEGSVQRRVDKFDYLRSSSSGSADDS